MTDSGPSDDEIDAILRALNAEGFTLPYSARSSDYLPSEYPEPSGWDPERRAEGLAALRAADAHAHQQNRDALRRALAGITANDALDKIANRLVGVRASSVHPDEVLHIKWSDLLAALTPDPNER